VAAAAQRAAAAARAERELSARQRARMADLSLLLDVILKTHAPAAKAEFRRCGLLHQLQVPAASHDPCSKNMPCRRPQPQHASGTAHMNTNMIRVLD
jgi:hypothetical protein